MKNILKKSLGILLVGGLILTSSMTVCTAENLYSTENQEVYGVEIGDNAFTIDDSESSDYGITADVTRKNILSLETSKASEEEGFVGFIDDTVVEIYDIKVNYLTVYDGEEVVKTTDSHEVCDKIIISIPCDNPNLYVLNVSKGTVNSDVSFKYKNGKYYFYSEGVGSFMLCTKPAGSLEASDKLKMKKQTLVDPNTGVKVSGKIPEGAMMYATFENVHWKYYSEIDDPNKIEYDYPIPSLKEIFTKTVDDKPFKHDYSWYENDEEAEGSMVVDVVFVKDYNILDFESDLTVTIPLDYYKVLDDMSFEFDEESAEFFSEEEVAEMRREAENFGVAKIFQLDHSTGNLIETEVVTQKGGKDSFEFKTGGKSSGTYFIGNELLIDRIIEFYGGDYKDTETFDKQAIDTTDKSTDIDVNINGKIFIVCLSTNAIWFVLAMVLVLKMKKKKRLVQENAKKQESSTVENDTGF